MRGDAESARIASIDSNELLLDCEHVSGQIGSSLFLSFAIEGRSYFFAASLRGPFGSSQRAELPRVVYVAERRDRRRISPEIDHQIPQRVMLNGVNDDWTAEAAVQDYSPTGLYVESAASCPSDVGTQVRVRYLDGAPRGTASWGIVRHARPSVRAGWVRLGVSTSEVPFTPPLYVERRRVVSSASPVARAINGLSLLSAGVSATSSRVLRRVRVGAKPAPSLDIVKFFNGTGEQLTGILDRSDNLTGGTAVVIPPAWGRTKETLLPLAATIVQTFRRAGESVSVLRFDGTRRRGESHKEPGFEAVGLEHLPLLFQHTIDDIVTSSHFLMDCPSIRASRVILITFSAASIEGRRALVADRGRSLSGWVSVVGSPDLQSGMRTVSGGIDYVAGDRKSVV